MHPKSRIDAIRVAAGGEISAAEIRQAAKVIEGGSTPPGILMSTIAAQPFTGALIEASEDRSRREEDAWLTLAAAGPERTRLALAWSAVKLVDPDKLVQLVARNRKAYVVKEVCERLADTAGDDEAWGAWLLLSWLYPSRLRAMVKAHPKLSGRFRAVQAALQQRRQRRGGARASRRVNPVIAAQLQALGLA